MDIALTHPSPADADEFIAAAIDTASLHAPWLSAPDTPERFAAFLSRASREDQASYLIHPSSVLDALSELFEARWDKAVPLNQRPVPTGEEQVLTDADRDLLGLLAAGTTDETIARTLGWSVRTVRRHIHRIMTLTGAETRFQAGMQASRRGWVLQPRPIRSRRSGAA